MWPKALSSLVELAPHLTRLVPMADKFLNSKSANEEANKRAMDAMADGLRGDLGQVTASHAGLYRQLNDQSETLATLTAELRAAKASVDATESRLNAIKSTLSTNHTLMVLVLLFNVATIVLLLVRH